MQKKLARSQRIMVTIIGKRIWTDVHLVNKHFAIFDSGVGILQIDPSLPQGFNLSTQQDDPGFIFVLYEIFITGLTVFCQNISLSRIQGRLIIY